MKKEQIPSILLLVVTVVLAVVSFILLPDTVITQLSAGGDPSTMPKLFAVAIPTLLGVCGAIGTLTRKAGKKGFILSAAGIVVFLIMLVVNL